MTGELTPSIVRCQVPAPRPVVTVSVAVVAESRVQVPFVTVVVPVTLFVTVTVEPLVQFVLMPTICSVIDWSATIVEPSVLTGMRLGETFVIAGATAPEERQTSESARPVTAIAAVVGPWPCAAIASCGSLVTTIAVEDGIPPATSLIQSR